MDGQPVLVSRSPLIVSVQPQNMVQISTCGLLLRLGGPFSKGAVCGECTLCPSPKCHMHTVGTNSLPVGCWIAGLRDGGMGWVDYVSVRLVKRLPWSFFV